MPGVTARESVPTALNLGVGALVGNADRGAGF
jgi:hypothetical protein